MDGDKSSGVARAALRGAGGRAGRARPAALHTSRYTVYTHINIQYTITTTLTAPVTSTRPF